MVRGAWYSGQRYQLGADGKSDIGKVELLFPVFGFCCAIPVNLRIAPLGLLLAKRKTGPRNARLAQLWIPCRFAYCTNCCLNPRLGHTHARFAFNAMSASSGVIFAEAMRYAHTTVALRLIPMKQ